MSQAVGMSRMMLEMRAMQAQASTGPKAASAYLQLPSSPLAETQGSTNANATPDFGDLFARAIDSVNDTQQNARAMSSAYERGDSGLDLPDVMIAAQKATISFEAMTQVRNKLLNAYEEIMKMPV